jgi:hypothetical protein
MAFEAITTSVVFWYFLGYYSGIVHSKSRLLLAPNFIPQFTNVSQPVVSKACLQQLLGEIIRL